MRDDFPKGQISRTGRRASARHELHQAFLVEKRLTPARDGDVLEKARLGERILGDEAFGLRAILGVHDQDAAVSAGAVVIDQRAGRKQLVLCALPGLSLVWMA